MRHILIILFSLLLFQASFSQSVDKFYFDCSASVYKGSEGKSIVELYYAVYQKFLKYRSTPSGDSAEAKLEVFVYPKGSEAPLAVNTYKIPSYIASASTESIKSKLVGQINYQMKFGEYKFVVIASDFNNPAIIDSTEFNLLVEDYSSGVKMSDIELATSINKSTDTKSIFYKNTLEVTPNAGGLYGKNVSELYYYLELYNLSSANVSDEITFKKRVLNLNNEEQFSSFKKIKRGPESRVETGMIKIDTMKSGPYILELSLIDSAKNINIVKNKKFFLFTFSDDTQSSNKGQQDYLKSEFVTLTESDLDDLFDKIIYIRTDEESKNYRDLKTLEEKRKYMFDFWRKRDNMPGTPQNEFKMAYFKRMNEANIKFKESFKDGWKTDRGRMYILYGAASEVEHHAFESDTKSYEVWTYDNMQNQGSANAVFIEREAGTGIYTLVSSTIRGEIRDDNWQSQLKQFH